MKKLTFTEQTIIFFEIALTFIWTYWISFKSPIVIDYGILIDRTWRIYLGQIPGRDFYCPTTPLTYLIQSFVFKLFSPKVFWMKIYLSMQMALLSFIVYYYARKILRIDFKFIALIAVPLTIPWSPGIQLNNPWYDVDGVFFSILTLCCLGIGLSKDGWKQLLFIAVAGACSGLSFLSKQNIGGGCIIAAVLFILLQPNKFIFNLKLFIFYCLGFSLPLCLMFLYFIYHHALHDAWQWMFVRAGSRYGSNTLISTMWNFNLEALTGPRNNFLKFLVPFYLGAIFLTVKGRKEISNQGNIFFGTALYCLIAMWIGILQEGGKRYSTQQAYLGLVMSILVYKTFYTDFKFLEKIKKAIALVLFLFTLLMFFWGATIQWRRPHDQNEIRWTVDQPRIKGIYFRRSDYEIVKGLLEFEKTIPKNERVFIMPDPLFFYFAADRLSPVPLTHFQVSGWELNEQEQKLVPEFLMKENVKWVIVGQEQYFDTGFLRFGIEGDWKTAVKKNVAMMSRSDYTELRNFIDGHYLEVPGPKGFWVLKRKDT